MRSLLDFEFPWLCTLYITGASLELVLHNLDVPVAEYHAESENR